MLRTDFKDDVFEGDRKYNLVNNPDGTVSLIDVTEYVQEGDSFGAAEVNQIAQAVNEAFQSASNGKQLIAGAITGKGVPTNPSDTFQKMADNINAIETDKTGDATATAGDLLSGKTAYVKGNKITGTIPSKNAATIIPSTTDQTIAAGQYLSGNQTIKGDENLIPSKIPEDLTLFGVQGTRSLGKKFATGTVTSGGTSVKYAVPRGDASDNTIGGYPITVSGLTFRPSVIVAIYSDPLTYGHRYVTVYLKSSEWKYTQETAMFGNIQYDGNGSFCGIRANVSPAYVNSTGFSLPTGYPGKTYTWYAWE